jgi:hypothetical protein
MPLREQTPTSLILTVAALALAILAGAVIAMSGGRGDPTTLSWTPPAPTIAAATLLPQPTATSAPTRAATATVAATATPTRIRPSATPAPTTTTPATAPVAALSEPAVARILQGPANLRAGPGRDFGVTLIAKEGATFEATGQTEDGAWVRLCCVEGAAVWVAGDLVALPAGSAVPVVK